MKTKSILLTVAHVGSDILLFPNGRGSYIAGSYLQFRRAGLGPMKPGEKRRVRMEIHEEEKRP